MRYGEDGEGSGLVVVFVNEPERHPNNSSKHQAYTDPTTNLMFLATAHALFQPQKTLEIQQQSFGDAYACPLFRTLKLLSQQGIDGVLSSVAQQRSWGHLLHMYVVHACNYHRHTSVSPEGQINYKELRRLRLRRRMYIEPH